jgi:hypothetical protein
MARWPWNVLRRPLACAACGEVMAVAGYRPWPGRLDVSTTDGRPLTPLSGDLQRRLAEQSVAAAGPDRAEAESELDYVVRNYRELFYEIRCTRGHRCLITAPRIAHLVRNAPSAWVTLNR